MFIAHCNRCNEVMTDKVVPRYISTDLDIKGVKIQVMVAVEDNTHICIACVKRILEHIDIGPEAM